MALSDSVCGYACCFALLAATAANVPAAGGAADTPPAAATRPATSAAATAPTGPTYALRLTRPVRVGDRYNYVADATVLTTMTANVSGRERTLRPSNTSIHFEALERVLALNARGEPSKATYTVVKCVRRQGKLDKELLAPGRVLTVEAGRYKSRIEADAPGITMREEIELRAVVSLPNLKDVSIDDAFGTKEPRRPGDSWPVNADALARLFSREGVRVKKEHVSGTVKLKAVQVVDGAPHLLVQGRATIEQFTPDPTILPGGTKFVRGSEEVKFTKLVPAGASGHCLTDSFSEKAMMKVRTDEEGISPDVLVDAKVLQTTGIKRTPAAEPPVASGGE